MVKQFILPGAGFWLAGQYQFRLPAAGPVPVPASGCQAGWYGSFDFPGPLPVSGSTQRFWLLVVCSHFLGWRELNLQAAGGSISTRHAPTCYRSAL